MVSITSEIGWGKWGTVPGERTRRPEMIVSPWRHDETFPFAHRSELPDETAGACDIEPALDLPHLWSCCTAGWTSSKSRGLLCGDCMELRKNPMVGQTLTFVLSLLFQPQDTLSNTQTHDTQTYRHVFSITRIDMLHSYRETHIYRHTHRNTFVNVDTGTLKHRHGHTMYIITTQRHIRV